MKRITTALAVMLLAGCSSGPTLFTSDGRPTQSVQCGNQDSSWQDCFAQARAQCHNGDYDIISRSNDNAARSLLIACR
jgi:hypothetical protein